MNGAPVEAHLGSKVSEMIPELFPVVEPYIRCALSGEKISDVEAQLPDSRGTRLVSYQPARDEAGEVVGVSIAITDISLTKRTEEALRKSEEHYRGMVYLEPQVLWVMDPDGKNLNVSPRWDSATGLRATQTSDHEWLKEIHPCDLARTIASISFSRPMGRLSTLSFAQLIGRATFSEGVRMAYRDSTPLVSSFVGAEAFGTWKKAMQSRESGACR